MKPNKMHFITLGVTALIGVTFGIIGAIQNHNGWKTQQKLLDQAVRQEIRSSESQEIISMAEDLKLLKKQKEEIDTLKKELDEVQESEKD